MYKLYGAQNVASFTPHVCLIKAKADFEFIHVDMYNKEHLGEEYRKLNPNGRIPVLIDNNFDEEPLVLYETAAICMHIAEHHNEANLFPALMTKERSIAYKWLMLLTNTIQTYLLVYYYADRYTADSSAVEANQKRMAQHIADTYQNIAAEFQEGNKFLLGDNPYLIDYFFYMLSEWAHDFGLPNGPLSHSVLKDYLERVRDLPEIQATIKAEGFTPSF